MSAGVIGAMIGLFLGVVGWRTMNLLGQRVDKEDTKRLLRIVGAIELVLMPALGYVLAELAFGDANTGMTA